MEDKIKEAIECLRSFEPLDGYFLAFSGGKCSVVIDDLALQASVRFTSNYSQTGIDPPELINFIKENYPYVIWHKYLKTMWQGIEENGLPTRWRRWCCRYLKHHAGEGRVRVTGIHRSESTARKSTQTVEKWGKTTNIQPILNWTDEDIWNYINLQGLSFCSLYRVGFKRLGCILCPLAGKEAKQMYARRYPKFLEAYRRANLRYALRKGFGEERASSYFKKWLTQ